MNSENSANLPSPVTESPGVEVKEGRRGFVKKMTLTAVAVGVGGLTAGFGRYMTPNVLYESAKVFKVGRLEDFPIGSRIVIEGRGIEVAREKDGLHAISLVCTHLGCLVNPVANDPSVGYTCPCHGSKFAPTGEVLVGPAPSALPWFEIFMDQSGALVVDVSTINHKRTKLIV